MSSDTRVTEDRQVLCYADPACRTATERLAAVVADIHQAKRTDHPRTPPGRRSQSGPDAALLQDAKPGLCGLVADWPDSPEAVQELLAAASRLRVPAYILNQAPSATIRRIVVASAGGVHALHVLALAEALGHDWSLPVSVLRIDSRTGDEPQPRARRLLESILARSFVLGLTVEIGRVPDLARQIDASAGPDDLLLIGAPHFGVAASHFIGSLPEQIARIHTGPMVMCLSDPPPSLPARDFLWEANLCLDVRGRDRDGIIRLLTDRLCESGVLPPGLRGTCVDLALAREALGSTAVDCRTALPHARLPHYDGVAAALAICPDGVDFGGDGEASQFVFLLISSAASHERYLGALARIAALMLRDDIRRGLLEAATPEAAMRLLEG